MINFKIGLNFFAESLHVEKELDSSHLSKWLPSKMANNMSLLRRLTKS